MKKVPLVVALIVCLAVATGPVSADDATSLISGTGWRLSSAEFSPDHVEGLPRVEFVVNVWITNGGRISGSYKYANVAGLKISGPVNCAGVAGSQAVIGGPITRGDLAGNSFLVFLTDNGRRQFGQIGPDVVSQTYILPDQAGEIAVPNDFPRTCPVVETAHDHYDVLGDIAVRSGG